MHKLARRREAADSAAHGLVWMGADLHRSTVWVLVTPTTSPFGFPCEGLVLISEHEIKLILVTRTGTPALLALAAYRTFLITLGSG